MFEIVYVNGENAFYKFGGGGDEEKNRFRNISVVYLFSYMGEGRGIFVKIIGLIIGIVYIFFFEFFV